MDRLCVNTGPWNEFACSPGDNPVHQHAQLAPLRTMKDPINCWCMFHLGRHVLGVGIWLPPSSALSVLARPHSRRGCPI